MLTTGALFPSINIESDRVKQKLRKTFTITEKTALLLEKNKLFDEFQVNKPPLDILNFLVDK